MKTYKVWLRICIEEHDTITDSYRNVIKNDKTDELEEFDSDSLDEVCIFESDSYEDAQDYINDFLPY